ncbi:pentapeptide repeat-containing protein [Nesterenkonia cremea]|uniref:Pentapeptide repeat-containing protein n=1 Tax=Nesterenkonia cremea TaxID=1882340 RepID=A0A917APC7_9MICC|nr:pentapeptide repeat-containing protein [Nesterenkonia cremea]GGE64743.1 hypothetical protein GCM10011401_09800 [Nesterenkonia cremea]
MAQQRGGRRREKAAAREPQLDLREPQRLREISAEEFREHAAAEGRRLTEDLPPEDLASGGLIGGAASNFRGASLVECVWEDASLTEGDLSGLTVAESRLSRLNIPHLQAPRSGWRDVLLEDSRIGVAELYDSVLSGVKISSGKLDLINLRGAELRDVLIEGCTLGELDLTQGSVQRVALRSTRVEALVLTGLRAQHLDLTGAEIGRIVGVEGLRGAVVSSQQLMELAPALADHLGLEISD